jgi:ketosteroid isomerase-like protein
MPCQRREEDLAMTVTTAPIASTQALVDRFLDSWNRHDVDAIMADMTDDCVFEIVAPQDKGGGRWEGQAAVRGIFQAIEGMFPGYRFVAEDSFVCGDRGALQWRLTWDLPEGGTGNARGIDVYSFRDGKIAAKIDYFTL